MTDYEKIVSIDTKPFKVEAPKRKCGKKSSNERDDLGGMMLNMFGRLDIRAICIIWISFIFLHSELFADCLKKYSPTAVSSDNILTNKGIAYSSFIMLFIYMMCVIIFN